MKDYMRIIGGGGIEGKRKRVDNEGGEEGKKRGNIEEGGGEIMVESE
jgi:hypothetical protein